MIKTDNIMNKPTLRVSVSDSSESNSSEDSEKEYEKVANNNSKDDGDLASSGTDDHKDTGDSSDDQTEDEETLMSNEGWKDSITKILGSSKPKNKKTLVLSRAKKHSEIARTEKDEKTTFEVIGGSKEEKLKVKVELDESAQPPAKKKKSEKASIRVKPNILEKDRERLLGKIATKGVVQLFNAVRNQQKTLEKTNKSDLTEGRKEKILKKFDKRTFLDTLMGQTKSIVVDEVTNKCKDEVKVEEKPRWNALRDDFMTGAKLKDWNKETDEDE